MAPGTFQSELHLSRHAFDRIHTLEHDGFLIYGTQAILRYLDRILLESALTPHVATAAARTDQLRNVND